MALASARTVLGRDDDEPSLRGALHARGLASQVLAWDDPAADWAAFDLVVVRSTWDYTERPEAFVAWARSVPRLANPAPVLAWNADKHYLADLASAGVPVVDTWWFDPGHPPGPLPEGDVVVKPTVGAGAVDARRFGPDAQHEARAHLEALLAAGRGAMAQPYVASVDQQGETALIYLEGRFSHAIAKPAILGERRPDPTSLEDMGIKPATTTAAQRAVAEAALAAVPADAPPLLYARVDLVAGPDGPLVLELEATEPFLFLGFAEGAAERLADAIAGRLGA